MSGLLDLLAPALSGKGLDSIGSALGMSSADTSKGVDAALPALLGHLQKTADHPEAGAALASTIAKDHGGGILDNLGGLGALVSGGAGAGALGAIFGQHADNHDSGPIGDIAKLTGLGGSQTKGLLAMLAPLVLGALGKAGGGGLTSGLMSSMLGSATSGLGGGSATQLLGGLASEGGGLGALGGITDAAKSALGGATGAAAAGVAGAATGALGSAAKAVTGGSLPTPPKPNLMKLAIPALVVLAALAFGASQCKGSTTAKTSTETTVAGTGATTETTVAK
jgi:hypothetical protein